MEKSLKRAGWFSILVSLIYMILGVIMITNPKTALNVVSLITGIVFLAVGIVKVINYFILKGNYDFYNYELIHGLVAFAIGVIILVYTNQVSALFVVLIGVWIIYSGLMSLNLSMKLHAANIRAWIGIFIVSFIMMIGGLYIAAKPESVMVFTGMLIIFYAAIELVQNLVLLKNIDAIYKR